MTDETQNFLNKPSCFRGFRGLSSVQAREKRPANISVKNAAEGENVSEIYILDEIGGWGIYAFEAIYHLRQLDGEGKTVRIKINSPGGDVFEGIAIANYISSMSANTEVEVIGLAASISSVIAISADKVFIHKNAQMMIHRPWAMTWGFSDELRKAADHLDTIRGQLIDIYTDHANGKKKKDDYSSAVDAETWLTGEESVVWGLADAVISNAKENSETQAKAKLDAEFVAELGIKNAPKDLLTDDAKEGIQSDSTGDEGIQNQEIDMTDETVNENISNEEEKNVVEDANKDADLSNNRTYTAQEVSDIKSICAKAKADDQVDALMGEGKSVDEVRAAMFDLLAERDAESQISAAIEGDEGANAEAPKESADEINARIRARQFAGFKMSQ